MLIQKIYKWYIIIACSIWSLLLIFINVFDTHPDTVNEQLLSFISTSVYWISLVPVIPCLWFCSLMWSLKQDKLRYAVFNGISIIAGSILWFYFLVAYLIILCGL